MVVIFFQFFMLEFIKCIFAYFLQFPGHLEHEKSTHCGNVSEWMITVFIYFSLIYIIISYIFSLKSKFDNVGKYVERKEKRNPTTSNLVNSKGKRKILLFIFLISSEGITLGQIL